MINNWVMRVFIEGTRFAKHLFNASTNINDISFKKTISLMKENFGFENLTYN